MHIEAPAGWLHFFLFVLTLILGLAVTVSFCLLIYVLTFFTISPQGLRMVFISAVEFFTAFETRVAILRSNHMLYMLTGRHSS